MRWSTVHSILSFGALGDGKTLNTAAIQSAIDCTSAEGGGVVFIPEGVFLSGAVFLKSGVSLRLDESAVLKGSADITDYPSSQTRFEGRTCFWPCALINAKDLDGLHVYGKGTIDGNGVPFYHAFWEKRREAILQNKAFVNWEVPRPRLLFIEKCKHVSLEEFRLRNSGFWNIHLYDCDDVFVRGIDVASPHSGETRAASTDGIDIDACQHVVLCDSTFNVDDDCICLKGGKGPDALQLNRVTKDILVENCKVGFGHGVVTFGSEACHVEDVMIRNLQVTGENQLVRFKFREDTDQCFEHITFEDIDMIDGWVFSIRPWVNRQDEVLGNGLPSTIRNLVVRRVHARKVLSPGIIKAVPPLVTIENLRIEDVSITTRKEGKRKLDRHDVLEEADEANPKQLRIQGVSSLTIKNLVIDRKAIGNQGGLLLGDEDIAMHNDLH